MCEQIITAGVSEIISHTHAEITIWCSINCLNICASVNAVLFTNKFAVEILIRNYCCIGISHTCKLLMHRSYNYFSHFSFIPVIVDFQVSVLLTRSSYLPEKFVITQTNY